MDKFLDFKSSVIEQAFNEYDTDVLTIGGYDYKVNGTPITHIAKNSEGKICAISCADEDAYDFWEYDFEQIALTKEQIKGIENIVEEL